MKIIFFGTPDFVLPVLKALYRTYGKGEEGVVAVVTQSPKEAGRKRYVERSAVDNWGFKHNVPVVYDLSSLPTANLGVVAAYGKLIPDNIIKEFDAGMLNIHPSLLPSFRGASPIQASIATGTTNTGVSIIKMDEQMDHGPVLTQFKYYLEETDTNETVRTKVFEAIAPVLIELIPNYLSQKITLKQQDHGKASFTRIIRKEDGYIAGKFLTAALAGMESDEDWQIPFIKNSADGTPIKINHPLAQNIYNYFRALTPWPGVWTMVNLTVDKQCRLKILTCHIENDKLVLDEVQLEGKQEVTWKQFVEGHPQYSFEG
ncbi:MAG: methionyl-tRNA formyltransferase [Patescibacteria group bacterium]